MKLAAGSVSIGLALIPFLCAPPMSASCNSGPDTCRPGYVWRRAFPGDHVCVPPRKPRSRTNGQRSRHIPSIIKWRSLRRRHLHAGLCVA